MKFHLTFISKLFCFVTLRHVSVVDYQSYKSTEIPWEKSIVRFGTDATLYYIRNEKKTHKRIYPILSYNISKEDAEGRVLKKIKNNDL